jgi:hypothetical protein
MPSNTTFRRRIDAAFGSRDIPQLTIERRKYLANAG